MSDTLMTIIGIFIAVLLMFIFPLTEMAGKNDEISQTVVQTAVANFVNTAASKGKITGFDYDALVQKIAATGNSYDIQIEVKVIDDNPRRATTTGDNTQIGEYKYYSVYTNTIIDKMNANSEAGGEREYLLKKDDYIIVTVKNTNITIGTQLKNLLYKLIGKETYTIGTSSSALVLNNGDEKESDVTKTTNVINYPEHSVTITTKKKTTITTTVEGNLAIMVILDCEEFTMPHHVANGSAPIYIQQIIDGVAGKGDLAFILTCEPNTIYENVTSTSFINKAVKDNSSTHYKQAFAKGIKWLDTKTENKFIVFLSWKPDQSYLKDAINYLVANQSHFDQFFNTYCCTDSHKATQWHTALSSGKSGGNLGTGEMKDRFAGLVNKTVTKQEWTEQSPTVSDSNNLKIILNNIDINQEIVIKVNGEQYIVGNNIPSYVVYADSSNGGKYVLDLELVIELLNMTIEDWKKASIELVYSQNN